MKGMLIKDFKLLRNMRNSLIIIVLVAVTSGAYLQDASFVIPYLAFIGATFASSTLSYDEYSTAVLNTSWDSFWGGGGGLQAL